MSNEKRTPRTYKLTEETLGQITNLAKINQITYTDVIELAVREFYQRKYAVNTKKIPANTSDKTTDALIKQLDIKDKQIADLSAALLAAQETAKAAQALHAVDKKEEVLSIESKEQKEESLTRWQRIKKAWKG